MTDPVFGDVRGERQVVPERIPAVDPSIEGQQRRARPLRGHDQREDDAHSQLDPADGRRRPQIGLLALSPLGHAGRPRGSASARGGARLPRRSAQAATSRTPSSSPNSPSSSARTTRMPIGENRVGQQRRRRRSSREGRAPRGPAGDRHREDDGHQADHAEDVVAACRSLLARRRCSRFDPRRRAGSAPLPQPFGSSSPLIRKTETRPEWTTSSTAGSLRPSPAPARSLALDGLFRSSAGVVTR